MTTRSSGAGPKGATAAASALLLLGVVLSRPDKAGLPDQVPQAEWLELKDDGSVSEAVVPPENNWTPGPRWADPMPQSGSGWTYELFTPPALYFDRIAGQFTAAPPGTPGEQGKDPHHGYELLAVRAELFPLQLRGYFGDEDNWLVALASPTGEESWLVRAGHRFASLGLTLVSFAPANGGAGPARGGAAVAGRAILREDGTGREIVLETASPCYAEEPSAVLRLGGQSATRAYHRGDLLEDGPVRLRVERVQLEPAEVVLAVDRHDRAGSEYVILRPTPEPPRNVARSGTSIAANPP